MLKNEEIKIRVPAALKAALKRIADDRFTSESEVAREALLAYLDVRGVSAHELREDSSSPAPAHPPSQPVDYSTPSKQKVNSGGGGPKPSAEALAVVAAAAAAVHAPAPSAKRGPVRAPKPVTYRRPSRPKPVSKSPT